MIFIFEKIRLFSEIKMSTVYDLENSINILSNFLNSNRGRTLPVSTKNNIQDNIETFKSFVPIYHSISVDNQKKIQTLMTRSLDSIEEYESGVK